MSDDLLEADRTSGLPPRPVAEGPGTSARELRAVVRRAGRRASGKGLGDVLGDLYTAVFAVVLAGVVLSGSRGTIGDLGGVRSLDQPVGGSGVPAPLLAVAGLLLVLGGATGLLARLGPLALGPGPSAWWLPLPVDRRALLAPVVLRRALVAGLGAAAAATCVVLWTLASRSGEGSAGLGVGASAALVLLAAGAATALTAAAGLLQAARGAARPLVLVGDAMALLAPVLVLVVGVTGPQAVPGWLVGRWSTAPLAVCAAVAAGLAVVATVVLSRRAGRVPGASLAAAGSLGAQVAGAGMLLDTRALGRALADPERRPRPGRGVRWTRTPLVRGPASALAAADALAVLRTPRRVVTPLVLAVVPAGAGAVSGDSRLLVLLAVGVCGYAAATVLAEPVRLRVLLPALDAVLPLSAGAAAAAHLAVLVALTTVATGVMGAALAVLAPGALPAGLVAATGPALAATAMRGASRPEPDWSGPVVASPMGSIPVGAVVGILRGPDLTVVALLPLAVGTLALVGGGSLTAATESSLVLVTLALAAGLGALAVSGARPPVPPSPSGPPPGGAPGPGGSR